MVLTMREKYILLDIIIEFRLEIKVFETDFPIFTNIKYYSNSQKNFQHLQKYLLKLDKFEFQGNSFAQDISTKYLYKIERKLRFKTSLDYFFAFAYTKPYQEIFKAKENKVERIVIAMDFNSMFIDSMMNKFLEPKSIKYIDLRNKNKTTTSLENGLYRVILKNPTDSFFRNFHPFQYTRLFKSFNFNLEKNQTIEIMLFKNEILYYQKFFAEVEILEGFYSKIDIDHPLKKVSRELYNKRLKYKKDGNQIMNNYMKFQLITMHSSTNSKIYKNKFFAKPEDLGRFLEKEFMLDFSKKEEVYYSKIPVNIAKISTEDNLYKLQLKNLKSHKLIYSISAQIIANSKLKMVQTIEKFLQFQSLEICYTNVDSLHISIQKKDLAKFMQTFSYMISNKLGDLKIETIADKGYWFDVGRYWLIKNQKTSLFKNITFNSVGNKTPFVKTRKIYFIKEGNRFNYVKTSYRHLFNSFSYNKKLNKKYEYIRYNFDEVENLIVAFNSVDKEILNSKKSKINLFNELLPCK